MKTITIDRTTTDPEKLAYIGVMDDLANQWEASEKENVTLRNANFELVAEINALRTAAAVKKKPDPLRDQALRNNAEVAKVNPLAIVETIRVVRDPATGLIERTIKTLGGK
jgi:hypothetical protein